MMRGPDCIEAVVRVTDYLESALPGPARARVEAHLDDCPDCREHLAQLRTTIRTTGRLENEAVPPHVRAALMAAVRDLA